MEEKYLITFEQIRKICKEHNELDMQCFNLDNESNTMLCSKETCPILKTLERPSITITPVRGK